APRRAGDEHEPAPLRRDALDDRRQEELANLPHARGDQAERGLQLTALMEDVDAKPAELRMAVADVDLQLVAQPLAVELAQQLVRETVHDLAGQHAGVRPLDELPADAEDRRNAD